MAVQVRAGLKAIYLSGWQVAGDANLSGQHPLDPRACIPPTRCRRRSAGSTTHCSAPTRSPRSMAILAGELAGAIVADGEAALAARQRLAEPQKSPDRRGRCGFALE